ncbi:MAG: flagellin-like protein [Natronomonas sp.]|jgi:flagellin-like protein
MKLKELLTDDDAVSPVIGVILMVAITVILAAVIATFVLGLGEQVSDTAPNANFQFDYEASGNDELTITHTSGPSIEAGSLTVGGPGIDSSVDWHTQAGINEGDEVSAGDSITIVGGGNDATFSPGDRVSIIWNTGEGDSATLSNYDIPK